MQPAGLAEIAAAKQDGRWDAAYAPQRDVPMPADLVAALAHNARAQAAFDRLGKSGQYAVMLPLLKAPTAASRAARLQKAITWLAAGDS
ncbi:MAG TPA: YdeI/OmpD-associated family protein, partial [Chloroflexia bacterium]|nr:YdeI/OmpD-associated family protein [Chloroflexia bacterium]